MTRYPTSNPEQNVLNFEHSQINHALKAKVSEDSRSLESPTDYTESKCCRENRTLMEFDWTQKRDTDKTDILDEENNFKLSFRLKPKTMTNESENDSPNCREDFKQRQTRSVHQKCKPNNKDDRTPLTLDISDKLSSENGNPNESGIFSTSDTKNSHPSGISDDRPSFENANPNVFDSLFSTADAENSPSLGISDEGSSSLNEDPIFLNSNESRMSFTPVEMSLVVQEKPELLNSSDSSETSNA